MDRTGRTLGVTFVYRAIFVVSTLAASWLGMQVVHEWGHVLGAWVTGRRVERIVLHPLSLSRTDLAVNPRPLVVAWAGPAVGVFLPVLAWLTSRAVQLTNPRCPEFLMRFFAGFCL